MPSQDNSDPHDPGATEQAAPRRVRLRDLYEAARVRVIADPDSALADYEQSLRDLIEARRARGE